MRVKGKHEPVAIFEPIGHKNDVEKSVTKELASYRTALKAFRAQDWDRAELDFFNLSRSYPDRYLYEVYTKRIAVYRENRRCRLGRRFYAHVEISHHRAC